MKHLAAPATLLWMSMLACGGAAPSAPSSAGASGGSGQQGVAGSTPAAGAAGTGAKLEQGGEAGVAGQGGQAGSAQGGEGGSEPGGAGGSEPGADTLSANRDRLLTTYLDYLKAKVTQPQSNGLSGSNVDGVCEVWSKLDLSSQAVFLTLTARMQGSRLGSDGSSMLAHITRVYRVVGGEGATSTNHGSCGGGEFNRMIMSMDGALHAALLAARQHKGAAQAGGVFDLADAPPKGTFWRDSHDLGGPHGPFDLSDETDTGAPRGQAQYFQDPSSAKAQAPLGRQDLLDLVDPYALELDLDYDCLHSSNPLCSYITYGPLCAPQPSRSGVQLCAESYGDLEAAWAPPGCP